MQKNRRSPSLALALLLGLALTSVAVAEEDGPPLYDRLGGVYNIAAVVDEWEPTKPPFASAAAAISDRRIAETGVHLEPWVDTALVIGSSRGFDLIVVKASSRGSPYGPIHDEDRARFARLEPLESELS